MLGDDIRRIDWNLYSRLEKYFVKLFNDERQMHVQIYIDCSASMGKDIPKKGQYAAALSAGLGFLAVHNMDKLSFKLIRDGKIDDSMGLIVGKNAFFRSVRQLESVGFAGESLLSQAVLSDAKSGARQTGAPRAGAGGGGDLAELYGEAEPDRFGGTGYRGRQKYASKNQQRSL